MVSVREGPLRRREFKIGGIKCLKLVTEPRSQQHTEKPAGTREAARPSLGWRTKHTEVSWQRLVGQLRAWRVY